MNRRWAHLPAIRVARAALAALAMLAGPLCAAPDPAPDPTPGATRPQLDAATAGRHRVADYLAQGPSPWQPAEVDAATWQPDFVVADDGSGTHRTVQAAVDAVPARDAAPGAQRTWVIRIRPGTYRGPLCVQGKPPLRLTGEPGQARAVTLVDGRHNSLPKPAGAPAQPCLPPSPADRHGTSGSATAVIASPDVLLAHLTIANDATQPGRPAIADGAQAVALLTLADRIQLEDVRLVSHQDTFYVRRPTPQAPARVFVRGSVIAGDVDFVFGNATLVIDDSTLVSRSDRDRAAPGDAAASRTASGRRGAGPQHTGRCRAGLPGAAQPLRGRRGAARQQRAPGPRMGRRRGAGQLAGRRVAQRAGGGARQRAGPAHRRLGPVDRTAALRCTGFGVRSGLPGPGPTA